MNLIVTTETPLLKVFNKAIMTLAASWMVTASRHLYPSILFFTQKKTSLNPIRLKRLN